MPLVFLNTLSGKKEEFRPITPPKVGMYDCGPTVYDFVHIGNWRAFVFADILRRVLELNGFTVQQVMNITDVGHLVGDGDEGEDKMTMALKREGKPLTLDAMHEVASHYTDAFEKEMGMLNITHPDVMPRASDHIAEDIAIIGGLLKKNIAYRTTDGIYFDISHFPSYGKLGSVRKQRTAEGGMGAFGRIAVHPEKHNPEDFALWKFNHELGWEAPWGKGFPGWHIECSAMSMKYLGNHFDIHTGGIDHIPVHHNNEIAQSESFTGEQFVNYWLHNAFVQVEGAKMAKSEGTGFTLTDMQGRGFSPLAYRYLLLTAHYRSPMNFTWEALQGAQESLLKLYREFRNLPEDAATTPDEVYTARFKGFVNDDLGTPQALALVWELLKDDTVPPEKKRATLLEFDRVLGFGLETLVPIEIPPEIRDIAEKREHARVAGKFEDADLLRLEIQKRGYDVNDTPEGPVIMPR